MGDDRLDNPHFGFTIERIWGLLGQCATDRRVAVRCPSLLSGMGRGESRRIVGVWMWRIEVLELWGWCIV